MDVDAEDIVVRLTLDEDDGVDSRLLVDAVNALEAAARDVAVEELLQFRRLVSKEEPSYEPGRIDVAVDAALERLRRFDGSSIRIVQASEGSLVVVGVVTALSYWLLEKTLGESFAEGWRKSQANRALTEWFRDSLDTAAARLARASARRLARKGLHATVELIQPPRTGIDARVQSRRRPQLAPRYGKLRKRID